ncbi:group II intron reverse transcriptase/maturase [Paenibacillus sp. FJAT-27812]|uniref:group II intron reverse transcriptase/maturase n=1 Tax=Paenibacillus sp. FJAT-27812 TaxID=1684143 RepID=UPI0006A7D8AC|nr:group II intron reverse transcriptase/maturase [Paenibacillus sp. FJAT-27812]
MNTNLRYNEYYGVQGELDYLYLKSKANKSVNLYERIISRENILLAYRTIKSNTGSKTKGTDGLTIDDFKKTNIEEYIDYIRKCLENYKPNSVRRVEIPKSNGKTRPLGIPTMRDRLIQQMFKQILEPICEAKFYNHSYGFRPNRTTHHAMARCMHLVNRGNLYHVVDVDIQGFFDNVNHSKLLKQMYELGIKDKRVLTIVTKMLKAPVEGIGIPNKGTPQGGILSPLLSNIVLNQLDWWIANQWEKMKTKYIYTTIEGKNKALKERSNLKQMYIVRYADDFKVFTNSRESAIKIFHAVEGYLKNELKLDISPEKSTITNLNKKSTDFLGFNLKAIKKGKKIVANTHVMDKKIKILADKAREYIKKIQKNPSPQNVNNYNSFVMGIKNYYEKATHISMDFGKLAYCLSRTLFNRLKSIGKYEIPKNPSPLYRILHKNNYKTFKVANIHLFPIADIQTKNAMNFSQDTCNYTIEGRLQVKKISQHVRTEINKMMKSSQNDNLEYADNRISKYSMQKGICAVTGTFLVAEEVNCHHIKPKYIDGTDEYKNLVIIHNVVHKLIHATTEETIERYMKILQLDENQLKNVNAYRKKCNLLEIN